MLNVNSCASTCDKGSYSKNYKVREGFCLKDA